MHFFCVYVVLLLLLLLENVTFFCLYQTSGFVFTPTDKEKSSKVLHLRYNSTKDQYCRVSNNSEVIKGWDQCVWTKESVFRKVESDWEMVCLILPCYVLPVKFYAVIRMNYDSQDIWIKIMQFRVIDLLDHLIAGLYCESQCFTSLIFYRCNPLFKRKCVAWAQISWFMQRIKKNASLSSHLWTQCRMVKW